MNVGIDILCEKLAWRNGSHVFPTAASLRWLWWAARVVDIIISKYQSFCHTSSSIYCISTFIEYRTQISKWVEFWNRLIARMIIWKVTIEMRASFKRLLPRGHVFHPWAWWTFISIETYGPQYGPRHPFDNTFLLWDSQWLALMSQTTKGGGHWHNHMIF